MKIITVFFLLGFCLQTSIFAQCADELSSTTVGEQLLSFDLNLKRVELVGLDILAGSSGTSWGKKDAEAVAVSIFVDDKYNQDVLLFAGQEEFNYRVLLGSIEAGRHQIRLFFNKKRSSPAANRESFRVSRVTPQFLTKPKAETDNFALANAPFIYARPNAVDKFTDIPLVMYYEIFDQPQNVKTIRYTTIFSHEDGGTQAAALMARWGRVTDIEWVYEIKVKDGKIIEETYQGANHETKNFQGRRVFGNHPLLFTVTDNNNFADTGCSALRFALRPARADLSNNSRETLMEQLPWTYRIMAEEVIRERRVDSEKVEANIIADPRDYLYVEVQTELQNAAISIEINGNNGEKAVSDGGSPLLRVNRNGFVRIALRLPPNFNQNLADKVSVHCHAADSNKNSLCAVLNVVKVVRLDKNFKPIERRLQQTPKINVKPGKAVDFVII